MRALLAAALLLAALLSPGPAFSRPDVLELAGANAHELHAFLDANSAGPDGERARAARYLVDNLPLADAAWMDAAQLQEVLDGALRARRATPWGADVPWEVFAAYVLPHRLSGEPFEPHRERLYHEAAPYLTGVTDMAQAARILGLWCAERLAYETTSRRDQGPLTTLRRGVARCEEAVILYAAVARAWGLPVREAITPAWKHADDNHAWAEVWVHGRWRSIDPANPGPRLDYAWFTPNVVNAPAVLAPQYGPAPASDEPVVRRGAAAVTYNVTGRYAEAFPLDVAVTGPDGAPLAGAKVAVSVFNYAGFKPVARADCNELGQGSVLLGRGTYLLTSAFKTSANTTLHRDSVFVSLGPGGAAAALDLRQGRIPAGPSFLGFGGLTPAPPPPIAAESYAMEEAALAEEKARLATARETALAAIVARAEAALAPALETAALDTLRPVLAKAAGNAPEVARAVLRAPEALRSHLLIRLARLPAKDLVELDAEAHLAEVRAALDARAFAAEHLGLAYEDAVFEAQVMDGRLSRYEPASTLLSDTADLARRLCATATSPLVAARTVQAWTAALPETPRLSLGHTLTPGMTLACGRVGGLLDRCLAAAALLRSVGVPARVLEQWGWVEFFDGEVWRPLYPERPDDLGRTDATEESRAYYATPAAVVLRFTRDGAPLDKPLENARFFREFGFARFVVLEDIEGRLTRGFFQSFEPDAALQGRFDAEEDRYVFRLPPLEWFVFAGARNTLGPGVGEPLVYAAPLRLESGKAYELTIPLELPE